MIRSPDRLKNQISKLQKVQKKLRSQLRLNRYAKTASGKAMRGVIKIALDLAEICERETKFSLLESSQEILYVAQKSQLECLGRLEPGRRTCVSKASLRITDQTGQEVYAGKHLTQYRDDSGWTTINVPSVDIEPGCYSMCWEEEE